MNTNTGKVYTDATEIEKAMKRGEPLTPIGERAAERITAGRKALASKLSAQRRRTKRAIQKASRKANR